MGCLLMGGRAMNVRSIAAEIRVMEGWRLFGVNPHRMLISRLPIKRG